MDSTAATGHLKIVRYLHENFSQSCTTLAMDHAAKHGQLDVVTFLHENKSVGCTTDAMDFAAGGNADCLEVIQFLHEQWGKGCTPKALEASLQSKDIDTIRLLHENQSEVDLVAEVAASIVHSPPELTKYACQGVPDAVLDTLLREAAKVDVQGLLGVLCAFSTKGCLFEAKKIALQQGHLRTAGILDAYISRDLESCSLAQHSAEGSRQCQCTTKALVADLFF